LRPRMANEKTFSFGFDLNLAIPAWLGHENSYTRLT
jgi:hypothetical protein